MHIKIFTTGGSIDKTYSTQASDFIVGEPQIGDVLRAANVNLTYSLVSVLKKDSLAITDEDRATLTALVEAEPTRHILITHGTDTMTKTAAALARIPAKVIVITGAMQPASFKHTDAEVNIGLALAALSLCASGVYIAMSGRVFAWDKTRKNMATNQFEDA